MITEPSPDPTDPSPDPIPYLLFGHTFIVGQQLLINPLATLGKRRSVTVLNVNGIELSR